MKITNLYVGNINMINKIVDKGFDRFGVEIKVQRVTLLYRKNNNSRYAKDIVYGGKYHIGLPDFCDCEIGNLYASNLTSVISIEGLDFYKKNVSKKKLLQIIKKGVENEKSI